MGNVNQMNKKGTSMINIPLGLIGFFCLILVLTSLIGVQKGEIELEQTIQILSNAQKNASLQFETNESQGAIINVAYSFVGFITYSGFEVTKAGVSYGIKNPEIVNPIVLLWLLILALCAPILIVLFKFGVIIFLLTKEYFQSRKEKKELRRMSND